MSHDQKEGQDHHPPPSQVQSKQQSNTTVHYSYTPKDDRTTTSYYNLRGLQSSKELKDSWSPFCAFCFSYKSNPPSQQYFERHYFNDIYGNTNPHLIRIAETSTEDKLSDQQQSTATTTLKNSIVSSVRIFQRYIRMNNMCCLENSTMEEDDSSTNYNTNDDAAKNSDNNNNTLVVLAGGIGEVCTHPHYRRQGLSNALLQNAIHIMETSKFNAAHYTADSDRMPQENTSTLTTTTTLKHRMQVSLLHAAPHFFPVYQKAGYTNVSSKWSLVPLVTSSVTVPTTDTMKHPLPQLHTIRTAQFPNDTQQLQLLHSKYSEQRLWGCIVRSTSYWNTYLSQEFKDSGDGTMSPFFVLEETTTTASAIESTMEDRHDPPKIVAWLSLRCFSHADKLQFQIREFGRQFSHNDVDDRDSIGTMEALSKLVPHAIQSILEKSTTTAHPKRMELKLPTFVLEEVLQEQQTQKHNNNNNNNNGDDDRSSEFQLLFDWSSGPTIQSDNDEGWMYRLLVPHEEKEEQGTTIRVKNFQKLVEKSSVLNPHFIWPSDSF